MIKVQVRSNEPLEAALRRFKRQCNYAGIFRLAKKHSFHEKASDKRRRERREKERSIQRLNKKPSERGGRPRKSGRKSRVKAPQSSDDNKETEAAKSGSTEAAAAKSPESSTAAASPATANAAGGNSGES